MTGCERKLYTEDPHRLYPSPNIIRVTKTRKMRWGHVVHIWEITNAYKILVGQPEGKTPLRRPKHRWENNVKMGLREKRFRSMDMLRWTQDRLL